MTVKETLLTVAAAILLVVFLPLVAVIAVLGAPREWDDSEY